MFTGIVQKLGVVKKARGNTLEIGAALPRLKAGDSVAINGACLTVTRRLKGRLAFDVSAETRRLTNLEGLKPGMRVNLEPALRSGDALGGHLVSGHVDARAAVLEREVLPEGFLRLRVELPASLRGLAAVKGSVVVDGVSLTVTGVGRDYFETVLVPHTLSRTTLGERRPGDAVNLEADMIARYVRSVLENK